MLLRENIFDRQRVLSGVLRSERFLNDIYPKLTLMIEDANSLLHHADFSSERLDHLQENTLGLIHIEQNRITRLLTLAWVFFLPAILIAVLYGGSVTHSPKSVARYGYGVALGILFLLWFLIYRLCKRKKIL
ncbi:MAG: hypothetical protein LUD68_06945 [Rikenellaceae bacterium]|nr:hypothetical protein [Rikenellaceae bacterium]